MHLAKRFYDLAAETSSDAFIPTTLALGRLNLIFALEYLTDVCEFFVYKDLCTFICVIFYQ